MDGAQKSKIKESHESSSKSKASWRMEEYMSEEAIDKKVSELVASRGKKGTDMKIVLRQFEMLVKASKVHGAKKEIPIVMRFISALFDSHRSIDDFMDLEKWRTCHRCLSRILQLLHENRDIKLDIIGVVFVH